jgi:hypothetical protein
LIFYFFKNATRPVAGITGNLAKNTLELNTTNSHNEVSELILIKSCLNCNYNFRMKPFIFEQNAVLDQPIRDFNPQMPIIIEESNVIATIQQ